MTALRRIMLAGGLDFTKLPETHKIYYTAKTKMTVDRGDFGSMILLHEWNADTNEAVIICAKEVTNIRSYAFHEASIITSITIPKSVTSIGYCAFYRCGNLNQVNISDLFAWCKIEFSDEANPLSNEAKLFINGEEATNIMIPPNVAEIKKDAFNGCTSIVSFVAPEGVTAIGDRALCRCINLESITLPSSMTTIGLGICADCPKLVTVHLAEGCPQISNNMFTHCTSLTTITIPSTITTIGYRAFYECSSLTSITIPDSVTSIGEWAFYECSSLTSVYCKPTTPPTLSSSVFAFNAASRLIYVPTESVDAYKAATNWSRYADYIVGYDFNQATE